MYSQQRKINATAGEFVAWRVLAPGTSSEPFFSSSSADLIGGCALFQRVGVLIGRRRIA